MAGRTVAALYNVLSLGLQGEVFVKRGHGIDTCARHTKALCKMVEYFAGQIVVMLLNILQNRNRRALLCTMIVYYAIDHGEVELGLHGFVDPPEYTCFL